MLKTVLRSNSIVTSYIKDGTKKRKLCGAKTDHMLIKEIGKLQTLKFTDNLHIGQGDLFSKNLQSSESEEILRYELENITKKVNNEDILLEIASEDEINNLDRKEKKYNGYLSYKAQRDIKRILDTWLETVINKNWNLTKTKRKNVHLPTFVTLTYPSKQRHDDNYLKRNHLNHFIINCKNKYQLDKYLWKAELQKNGNIHFHLIFNCYINHKELREEWNNIIERDDYITEFEKKHNHRKPNSTDVKALKGVKNISAYISKYCAKIETEKQDIRVMEGRIWGCSDNIRNIKQPNLLGLVDKEISNRENIVLINELIDCIRDSQLVEFEADMENYSTYIQTKIPIREVLEGFNYGLSNLYQEHYSKLEKELKI